MVNTSMKVGILIKIAEKKMQRSLSACLALFALLLSGLVVMVAAPPSSTGDWIITGTETLNDTTIKLNGSIIVQNGGRLELTNVTIIFMLDANSEPDGAYNITVETGGTLIFTNVTVMTDSAAKFSYLEAKSDSLVVLEDVLFQGFGYGNRDAVSIFQPRSGSNFFSITVHASHSLTDPAFSLQNGTDVSIINLHLVNGSGLMVYNSTNVTVSRCLIESNGLYSFGMMISDVLNASIMNSTIIAKDGQLTTYGILFFGEVNGTCENNTITSQGNGELTYGLFSLATAPNESKLVLRNNFVNASKYGVWLGINIFLQALSGNNVVTENTIQVNKKDSAVGIFFQSTKSSEVIRNHVQTPYQALYMGSIPLVEGEVVISNNSFHLTADEGLSSSGNSLVYLGAPNTIFEENFMDSVHSYPMAMKIDGDNVTVFGNSIHSVTDTAILIRDVVNVTIQENVITPPFLYGLSVAINASQINNSKIIGNVINSSFDHGIWLNDSRQVLVKSNIINESQSNALSITYSKNITISDNAIKKGFSNGLVITHSNFVMVSSNHIINFREDLMQVKYSNDVMISSNVFDNAGDDALSIFTSNNLTVSDNIFTNSSSAAIHAIDVDFSDFNGNVIQGSVQSVYGIILWSLSDNNTVQSNVINGVVRGISLWGKSNLLSGNEIMDVQVGMLVRGTSEQSIIRNNFLRYCSLAGIEGEFISDYRIEENVILSSGYGILLKGSSSANILSYNAFAVNDIGILLEFDTSDNIIHHNDFVANALQAWDETLPGGNQWNETERGNYWSDYDGPNEDPPYEVGDVPYNVTGNIADFYPLVESPNRLAPPRITSPRDITYYQGETGHLIRWNAYDSNPDSYVVTRNGTVIASGLWNGLSPIEINVDGLGVGTWIFEILLNDTDGRTTNDTVFVMVLSNPTIDVTPPTVSQPADVVVRENETTAITWLASDENPFTYQILINGSVVDSGNWQNGPITFTINPAALGLRVNATYNVTIVILDSFGNQVTDSVFVTVISDEEDSVSSKEQKDFINTILSHLDVLVIGMLLGFLVSGIALLIIRVIKRRRSSS